MRIPLLLVLGLVWAADPWEALAAAGEDKAALERLLTEHPGFHAARYNLGTLLLATDPAAAATQFELATAAGGAIAIDAWHNLILARTKQGRWEEALVAAEKAAALDPALASLRDEVRRVLLARRDEARRAADEAAKKLHVDTQAAMPLGRVGQPYEGTIPVRGGQPPYAVQVLGKQGLPEGLSLSGDRVSGTPRTPGTFRLDVNVTDAAKTQFAGTTSLTIVPAPAITTERLPEAVLDQPYRATLAAQGLDQPVRWEVARLPLGLTAAADGTLSGTPTQAGSATLHVHATDGTRQTNRLIELVVSDAFAPAEDPLPPATANAPYRWRATVRGPTQEYRWSGGGSGLTLAADGTVMGTVAQPGEVTIPGTIAAADGRTRDVSLHLTVHPAPLIDTTPLQLAAKQAVDRAVPLTGGTPPFTWAVVGGSLPAGLRLDPDGHLRGAAQDQGKTTVTVTATDAWKAVAQADLPIEVTPPQADPPPEQAKQDGDKNNDDKNNGDKNGDKDQSSSNEPKGDAQDQARQGGKDEGKNPGKDPGSDQGKPKDSSPDSAKGTQDQAKDGPQDHGTAEDGKSATAQGEKPDAAKGISQTAAGRWLDQLPAEDRDVLRYQLLEGGQKDREGKGKAW